MTAGSFHRAVPRLRECLPVAVVVLLGVTAINAQYDGYTTDLLQLSSGSDCRIPLGAKAWGDDLLAGESTTDPALDETLVVAGTQYVWELAHDDDGLWEATGDGLGFAAYWSTCIITASPGPVRIRYRHTAALRVWVYGHLLIDESAGQAGTEKLSGKSVVLPSGKVRLLFKLQGSSGVSAFGAKIVDSAGGDLPFVIYDNTAGGVDPAGMITILSPRAGESYAVGGQLTVRWLADFDRLAAPVAARISVNDGRSWSDMSDQIQLRDPAFYSGDTGTLVWTVVDSVLPENSDVKVSTVSAACRVKVFSQYDPNYPNVNTGAFAIQDPAAVTSHTNTAHDAGAGFHATGRGMYRIEVASGEAFAFRLFDTAGRLVVCRSGTGTPGVRVAEGSPGAIMFGVLCTIQGRQAVGVVPATAR